jgi:Na+:H+ antiporter, NhaA family
MQKIKKHLNALQAFLHTEAASGAILVAVALAAMLVANSSLLPLYETIFSPTVQLGINDGLMVVFFLLVGLEIRAETRPGGALGTWRQAALPLAAAAGGVVVPALIYTYFNHGTDAMHGWAIPAATDIAFALGVLALFGSRLPPSLKILLMAIAVIDDLIAVIIIALFYTASLNLAALGGACVVAAMVYVMARKECAAVWPYLLAGLGLWALVLASGVHATIAGVVLGLLVPAAVGATLIKRLHASVAYGIIPLFAFANAGVPLAGMTTDTLTHPITLGIALGLLLGKPLGIFGACLLMTKAKLAPMPHGARYPELLAISVVAGIGFTMSLFIGKLAFDSAEHMVYTKLGVMLGSLASIIVGAMLLMIAVRHRKATIKTTTTDE